MQKFISPIMAVAIALLLSGCVKVEEKWVFSKTGPYSYSIKMDLTQMVAMMESMKNNPNFKSSSSSGITDPCPEFIANAKKHPEFLNPECSFDKSGVIRMSFQADPKTVGGALSFHNGWGIADLTKLRFPESMNATSKTSSGALKGKKMPTGLGAESDSHPQEAKSLGMSAVSNLRFPGKILHASYGTKVAPDELSVDALVLAYEKPDHAYVVFALGDAEVAASEYAEYVKKPVKKNDASIPPKKSSTYPGKVTTGSAPKVSTQTAPKKNVPAKKKNVPAKTEKEISGPSFDSGVLCGSFSYVMQGKTSKKISSSPLKFETVDAWLVCQPGKQQRAYPVDTATVRNVRAAPTSTQKK